MTPVATPAVGAPAVATVATGITRRHVAALGAVVAGFVAIATAYAVRVPLGGPSDEPSHLGYVRLLADHLALPSATTHEKQQPPLYYLLAAGLSRLGVPDQGLRGLNVALGALTVLAAVAAVRLLLPGRPGLAVAAGALVAATPVVQAESGAVTDDVLAWLVGAVLVGLLAATLRSPAPGRRLLLGCALAVAAGLLAKESDWPLVATLAVAVAWRTRPWRLGEIAPLVLVPVLAAGWWFVRNLVEFHALTPPLSPITDRRQYLRSLSQLRGFASEAVRSLFGPEAPNGGPLPRPAWAEAAIAVLTAAGAWLAGWALVVERRLWPASDPRRRATILGVGAACLLLVGVWLLNSVVIDLQPQARYLVVAEAVAAAVVVRGAWLLWRVSPVALTVVVTVAAALLLAVDIDGLRVAARVGV